MDNNKEEHSHVVGYGTYVLIWLALLAFTGITVSVAGLNFGGVTLFLAVLIAIIKSSLVLNIFMHIKFEDPVFKVFLSVAIITIISIFFFTFADILFR